MINNCRVTKTIMISLGAIIVVGVGNGLVYFIGEEHRIAVAVFMIAIATIIFIFNIIENHMNMQFKVRNEKGKMKEFIRLLKIRLFEDVEPCCHGVTERDAIRIIDELAGEKSK